MTQDTEAPEPRGRLGTFAGVFTPSILTILGIILFLRLGYVVGQAGLGRALLIVAIANAISVLTSLSLAAIATNLRVGAGGDYYLISRTLGPGFGGSIGIVLFLAQAVSIAFYATGFGEALSALLAPHGEYPASWIAAAAVALLFVFAWLGTDWTARFQFVVMAVLAASLVSFFAGAAQRFDPELVEAGWRPSGELPFWAVFAIFFPAVTGFTQGVSLSGDLADPGKSIPRGTFLAVGLSAVVYVVGAVLFAGSLPGETLAGETDAMWRVSRWRWLADAGVIAATLSSAMASFLGAPRILQSLAGDRLFPALTWFAKGVGPTQNPRRGVLLSAAIAFATIALGDLDLVARVVSMFFLISYGLLNYATYVEARGKSPYFRPRFHWFHPRQSLAGALACAAIIVMLDVGAAAFAAALLFGIFWYVDGRSEIARWADSRRSGRFQSIRKELLGIARQLRHPRDWRPVLLVFTNDAGRRQRLLRFASWIEGGAGFTTVVKILIGETTELERERTDAEKELRGDIERIGIEAFPLVVTTPDVAAGLVVMLQSHGLGAIQANTVLMNWFDRRPGEGGAPALERFGTYLRLTRRQDANIVILEAHSEDFAALEDVPSKKRTIDVWYEDSPTGRLMLLFAYLTTRSSEWRRARIRLFAKAKEGQTREAALAELVEELDDARIDAEPEVVEDIDTRTVANRSGKACLVFLPFRLRGEELVGAFGLRLDGVVDSLPMTALVLAAEDIDLDAGPEEGPHGEIAKADATADTWADNAARAQRDADGAAEVLAELEKELARATREGADAVELAALERSRAKAADAAEQAKRRAAKARAKADQAEREAQETREKAVDG